ncbi:hypothetical protein Pan241w_48020 [Gimesia alba]|uniref:Alpha/beta hydrolase family protein n=1 Tax=Gimesia alba TaxID=2527973 RepID=A0A517RLD9_9PLAN|nr:hypothetical protein [Gimesia alba]QDT44687.1 hypothetical protein Pan241w_48020 [Gimesia alba]
MQSRRTCLTLLIALFSCSALQAAETPPSVWPGFQTSPWFDEQISYLSIEPEVRLIIVAPRPERIVPGNPSRVILFATPNGSTIEQTLGCQQQEGRDWHFDIQHIAAQHRKWQSLNQRENLILVCLEAEGLSWPRWRARHPDNPKRIRTVVNSIMEAIPLKESQLTLACHSGGGSFLWGFLNGSAEIPDQVDRFVFLDANYSFSEKDQHGKKFLNWLKGCKQRRLVVLAYDDRNVLYRGKKVVSPTGGTYRATHRMLERFKRDLKFSESSAGDYVTYAALEDQVYLLIHGNPQNKILHTRLVGEMNGYLYAVTLGTPEGKQGRLPGPPRTYSKWVQPEPFTQPETENSP